MTQVGQTFIFNDYQISFKGVNLFMGHPVEVLKNELDRLRSLRSSDVVKNKKKGSKLVEVEDGEIFEKKVSKLQEIVPPAGGFDNFRNFESSREIDLKGPEQ